MNNEEFQKVVIDELKGLRQRIDSIESRLGGVEEKLSGRIDGIEGSMKSLEERLTNKIDSFEFKLTDRINSLDKKHECRFRIIEDKLDAVYNQVADLTEFKTAVSMKLGNIIEENKSIYKYIVKNRDL
jgi:predicted  nucleic acid-binding Zn-ribbon protein